MSARTEDASSAHEPIQAQKPPVIAAQTSPVGHDPLQSGEIPPQGITTAAVDAVVVLVDVTVVDAVVDVLVEVVALVELTVVALVELLPGGLVGSGPVVTLVVVELPVVALVGTWVDVVVVTVVVVGPGVGDRFPTRSFTNPSTIVSILSTSPVVAQPPFTSAFANAAPKRSSARARHPRSTARFFASAFCWHLSFATAFLPAAFTFAAAHRCTGVAAASSRGERSPRTPRTTASRRAM